VQENYRRAIEAAQVLEGLQDLAVPRAAPPADEGELAAMAERQAELA
jgi:hypothetical protein